jgi:aspartate carbamoyltransferase catalytic subunit
VIVLRHYEGGSARRAAEVASVPVLNAGDGPGQHPTQALLDVYTIQKEIGRLDGISVAMVGDLANGRTVRSLAYLLTRYEDVKLYFVAPEMVRMKADIKEYLLRNRVYFEERDDLIEVVRKVDVVYQTRIQRERFGDRTRDYETARGRYIIDTRVMEALSDNGRVMHPLPRVDEIDPAVDTDPRAAYFRQAHNGLYIRMALLKMVLAA